MSVDINGTKLYRGDKEQPQLFMLARVHFRSGPKDSSLWKFKHKRWFVARWQMANCDVGQRSALFCPCEDHVRTFSRTIIRPYTAASRLIN